MPCIEMRDLWEEGVLSARKTLLENSGNRISEKTVFDVWSETIRKIYSLNYKDDDWELASDEEKLKAFKGKSLSFENFKTDIKTKILN